MGVQTGESFNIMLPDRYYHRLFSRLRQHMFTYFPKTSTISIGTITVQRDAAVGTVLFSQKQPVQNLTLSAALAR